MGKTYRYNSEECDDKHAGKDKSHKKKHGKKGHKNFVRRVEQPEEITVAWAVSHMADHIAYVVAKVVIGGYIEEGDAEEFAAILRCRVMFAVSEYDPDRKNEDGQGASALNFFTHVVNNAAVDILRMRWMREKQGVVLPIMYGNVGEILCAGGISVESEELSDGCRNVRDLIWKMDVRTLVSMMCSKERMVFSLRYAGYSHAEIGDVFGCSKQYILQRYISSIRRLARICGFIPRSEVREGSR